MILTDVQRAAVEYAIKYIPNWPSTPKGCRARDVLRAMIDSSEHLQVDPKMVELLAAGEHEQWAAWAQAILDSEPGLSDGRKAAWPEMIATPYENLSEELKDEDRRVVHLRSQAALDYIQQQSTEIERLRAIIDTPPEEGEWILDLEVIDRGTRSGLIDIEIAKKWHAAYRKAQNSNLLRKQENERLRAETEEAQESLTAAYLLGSHKKAQKMAARIAELEADVLQKSILCGSLAEICTRLKSDNAGLSEAVVDIGQERDLAQAEGKIGPDARPPCWQITEERVDVLGFCLSGEFDRCGCAECDHAVAVLRAMLKEAL